MWRCLNCETVNSGEVCVICGEPKPSEELLAELKREAEAKRAQELREAEKLNIPSQPSATGYAPVPPAPVPPMAGYTPAPAGMPPYAPPVRKKRTGLVVFIIILVLLLIGGAGFGVYYILNNDVGISAGANPDQTQYDEAMSLLDSGDFEGAKSKFKDLGSYSDAEDMVKECDYRFAESKANSGSYIEAYDLYHDLGDYKESQTKKNSLKPDIYSEGIEYYSGGSYDAAEKHFEYVMGYQRANDYLLLIDAHNDDLYNVEDLYDILDLADAKNVVINRYAFDFLKGYWSSPSGLTLSFYNEGNSQWCKNNFQSPSGSNWKIEDGIHYVGDSAASMTKAWSYTIVDEDTITVYNYSTYTSTTLRRN